QALLVEPDREPRGRHAVVEVAGPRAVLAGVGEEDVAHRRDPRGEIGHLTDGSLPLFTGPGPPSTASSSSGRGGLGRRRAVGPPVNGRRPESPPPARARRGRPPGGGRSGCRGRPPRPRRGTS